MSKSFKKFAAAKVKGSRKDSYWKTVRRKIKTQIKKADNLEELEISDPKEILGDHEYNGQRSYCEDNEECICMKKFGRQKCKEK